MTAAQLWGIARRRLIEELGCDIAEPVSFVDDERVKYEVPGRILVSRADLFDLSDHEQWQGYLDPQPTWLHFNLLTVEGQPYVVTVRRSHESAAADDVRETPVNVSAESTPAYLNDA